MEEKDMTIMHKFFKNSFGNNQKFFVSIIITGFFGITYSFKIYDYDILLFVFGMILPVLYIIGVYQMFRKHKDVIDDDVKTVNFLKSKHGNLLFMTIDIAITLGIGVLIYIGILDYILFKLLVTFILPVIYQIMIKFFLTIL